MGGDFRLRRKEKGVTNPPQADKNVNMLKYKRPLYLVTTVLYLGGIFYFSSIPCVSYNTSLAIRIFYNLLHIPLYGGLTFLLFHIFKTQYIKLLTFLSAGLVAFIIGIINEVYQSFVAGRITSLLDLLLNGIGIALTLLFIIFYYKKLIMSQP